MASEPVRTTCTGFFTFDAAKARSRKKISASESSAIRTAAPELSSLRHSSQSVFCSVIDFILVPRTNTKVTEPGEFGDRGFPVFQGRILPQKSASLSNLRRLLISLFTNASRLIQVLADHFNHLPSPAKSLRVCADLGAQRCNPSPWIFFFHTRTIANAGKTASGRGPDFSFRCFPG